MIKSKIVDKNKFKVKKRYTVVQIILIIVSTQTQAAWISEPSPNSSNDCSFQICNNLKINRINNEIIESNKKNGTFREHGHSHDHKHNSDAPENRRARHRRKRNRRCIAFNDNRTDRRMDKRR
jgi:hypothetical protein